ncbi:dolichol kinase isoform X2 [Bacillus rossius redtenbacheri]|uniref:dolichol kinase isoform X2 n=1 Tax=Bacillus rossius redtenbacheri TaxID=93214 RepID=UPI002FDEE950
MTELLCLDVNLKLKWTLVNFGDICFLLCGVTFVMKTRNSRCRPGAGDGEWLNALLPLAVLVRECQTPVSPARVNVLTVGALGLVPSVAGTFVSRTWPGKSSAPNTLACCVASALFVFAVAKVGVLHSIAVAFFMTFGFQHVRNLLLEHCPLSFTIGEASVVSQGLLLFITSCENNVLQSLYESPKDCVEIVTLILQVGLLGVGLICGAVWLLPALRAPVPFYTVVLAVAVGMVVPALYFLLEFNPVKWIWLFMFETQESALSSQVEAGKRASTSVRKCFHVLAVAVFLPGLIMHPCLLYLSSGVVLALFLILEAFRILQMPPLGGALQDSYSVFVDEKDAGGLALTPIYLLVGCCTPMWLHPVLSSEALLPLMSGLLAVGIGDTAASVYGHKFGRHKWKDSKKTKEGTAACIIFQMAFVAILMMFGLVESNCIEYVRTLIAVVSSSIVEAKTDQVDNLCLPLITYLLLNVPIMFTCM